MILNKRHSERNVLLFQWKKNIVTVRQTARRWLPQAAMRYHRSYRRPGAIRF
jgi:hypothetical protein